MTSDFARRRLAPLALSLSLLLIAGASPVVAAEPPPGWSQETLAVAGVARAHLRDVELEAARDGRLIAVGVRSSPDISPSGLTILERTAGATGTWRRLAITNNFDSQASLAVAAGGAVNVAWARAGAGIRFTSNKSGTWKVEVISTGGVGYSPSIALTNGGTPSIAFVSTVSRTAQAIGIASKTASGWNTRTIVTGPVADPSLRIDQFGKRHLVYMVHNGSARGLFYATDRSGTWRTTRLTSATDVYSPRLVLDLARHVHVAYERSTPSSSRVLHVTNAAGAWVTTTASAAGGGSSPDLTLDANQRPVISYLGGQAGTSAPVWIATRTATGWTRTAATTDALTGRSGVALRGTEVNIVGLLPFADPQNDGELVHVARK